ncbi:transposase [Mangrovicoccus sp. HB161399]|uniref:transposase n=1 Tax=Mangrovicoccus sp. HB161399 TaxID=2720392 RepID=UPI00352F0C60
MAGPGGELAALCAGSGRPPIAPERLVHASLLQILFPVRSGRQPVAQLDGDLPFRWSAGLGIGSTVRAEGARTTVRRTDSGPGRAQPRDGGRPSSAGAATACPPRTCRARRWPPSRRIARPPRCCRTAISRPAARWRRPGRR